MRRIECRTCGSVKRERLDFLADNPRYTKRFAFYVGRRCRQGSIRDVAKVAGVSTGTVSNVLNRPDIVAESTRRRVLQAVESTGFIRNTQAHQLRGGRSQTVGVVVLDVANPLAKAGQAVSAGGVPAGAALGVPQAQDRGTLH